MRCPACEYDLRGSPGEWCPECGRAIERLSHPLQYLRLNWFGRSLFAAAGGVIGFLGGAVLFGGLPDSFGLSTLWGSRGLIATMFGIPLATVAGVVTGWRVSKVKE